jgi:hypothetical protein
MFELTLAAECRVSFGRDGLDASKACHISAKRRCAHWEATGQANDVNVDVLALSSRPGLRQLVALSDGSLPDGRPCICALAFVHDIVPVFDLQDFLPVQSYLNQRLVFFWKPEGVNFLILP